jgi:hypothetical protein
MRCFIRLAAVALTLSALVAASSEAEAGCYRVGLSGYHWYHSCFGPHFLYPHHRVCNRHGYCYYR